MLVNRLGATDGVGEAAREMLLHARFSVLSARFSVGIGTVSDRLKIEFMPCLASVLEDIIGGALVVILTDNL